MPGRRGQAGRVALGWLDVDDAGTEAQELPARERSRQVPGEVDDEHALERLHGARP